MKNEEQKRAARGNEETDIRRRTFGFALRIVKLCQHLESRGGIARTLGRQLLRAGTSIGANVEEAQAAQSRPDFINKMSIALKEAREADYWVRLLGESQVVPESLLADLRIEGVAIGRVLGAILVSTKRCGLDGASLGRRSSRRSRVAEGG